MIKSKSIVIIPCKMDSERLKGKNLSLIGDKTLLEYSILWKPNRVQILMWILNKLY